MPKCHVFRHGRMPESEGEAFASPEAFKPAFMAGTELDSENFPGD
jgi:hypothetical protein